MGVEVGDTASVSKTITQEDIRRFGDLVGDLNPVHFDEALARQSGFGGRVAHGMLAASLISAAIGNHVPGPGSVYLSQTLRFLAPAYPGDTVTARVTVSRIRSDKPIMTLETICVNQHGEQLIEGEAVVLHGGVDTGFQKG